MELQRNGMNRSYENLFSGILRRGTTVNDGEIEQVYQFCEVVYSKHFLYKSDLKEDLLQEGFFGILKLIREDHYDSDRSAMNFVYTKVRNSMTDFLAKKTPDLLEDDSPIISFSTDGQYDEIVKQILEFVDVNIICWPISENMSYYITTYFNDKFGVEKEILPPANVTVEFIIDYDYYVNYLEYLIMGHFMEGRMFQNDVSDIIKILDHEGVLSPPVRTIAEPMDKETLVKVFYILSGNTIKFPSKSKLLRTDYYLNIYKSIDSGRYSFEEASKFFCKPLDKIQQIYRRYKKITHGERE